MRKIFRISFNKRDFRFVVGIIIILAFLYFSLLLARKSSSSGESLTISLSPLALFKYSLFSLSRMGAAYLLSLIFSLFYGYLAAYNKKAEMILMPLLDVLQSVPILSFLPVTLLAFSTFLSQNVAAELASIVLIFTSQAWNITFAWYQSLITIPKDLDEASRIFRLNKLLRLKTLELPFAAINLIWNSMMSWAGGWFFLMAAEMFTVGNKDFRLPGLGSYLQTAADKKDIHAILMGLFALILIIVILDQLVWRPLLAWSAKFKIEYVESDKEPSSWFYNFLQSSGILEKLDALWQVVSEKIDMWSIKKWPFKDRVEERKESLFSKIVFYVFVIFVVYEAIKAFGVMMDIPSYEWKEIFRALGATTLRVFIALVLSLAWTIPAGVAIGRNEKLAGWLQPLVQVIASIPATALFPVFVLIFLNLPGGLNVASVVLMMAGTQWYILFNVIAGASSIPKDLEYTTQLLHLSRWEKWKVLILPAIFPYVVTGGITAAGGAWNASIVAEYIKFGGKVLKINGLGELIALSTANGNYPLLFTSTVVMIVTVVLINRLFWKKLYDLAHEKFSME
ncbi:ABC transporter permease [Desulfurobacterium sp.]